MRETLYRQLSEVEDRHWWHRARADLVRATLRRFRFDSDASALDVGCGTGGMLRLLSEFAARVVGVDRSATALQWARRKHPDADLRQADANALTHEFSPESFDLITLFNVLYHEWIRDDLNVLRQARKILKPGGLILVTEAAFPSLTRRHDRLAMGSRRYTLRRMRELLTEAGLEWRHGTCFNLVSFIPAWILARWQRHHENEHDDSLTELRVPPTWLNAAMKSWMDVERMAVCITGSLPLGVSLLCTATRPAAPHVPRQFMDRPATRESLASTC